MKMQKNTILLKILLINIKIQSSENIFCQNHILYIFINIYVNKYFLFIYIYIYIYELSVKIF